MMNAVFTVLPWLLCAWLALLIAVAVVSDLRRRIISNRLNLLIAATAPLYWLAVGLDWWPDAAVQVGLALAVFAIFALFFHFGAMGGGDVKLAAALSLWFAPIEVLHMVLYMSIAGAPITLAAWFHHRRAGKPGRVKVPYGVAIAIGAGIVLAQRYLNHFG